MNDDIFYTPAPSFEPLISVEPVASVSPVTASPQPVSELTPEARVSEPSPTPEAVDRSLNPPSVSDSYLRRFAAIIDANTLPTEQRDYIIFAEYGNYNDVSLYLFDKDSSLSADGTVSGTYTRYRIFSSYDSDARFQVYEGLSSKLVFPRLGDTRSANVYSNVLGYSPNPYFSELQHSHSTSVFNVLIYLTFTFAALLALMMGVIGKCLRK